MRHVSLSIKLLLILFCSLVVLAQPADKLSHYDKDGLSFDYPEGWTLAENSNSDAQQLVLERAGSDAQIRIFAHRGRVDTADKLAQARTQIIDPYLKSTSDTFVQMGAKPEQSPATLKIGETDAQGVRIRAVLDSVPGEAAIYWFTLGNRLIVLTFFGPDQALKQATPAWDTVRNSLRITESKPAQGNAPRPGKTPDKPAPSTTPPPKP